MKLRPWNKKYNTALKELRDVYISSEKTLRYCGLCSIKGANSKCAGCPWIVMTGEPCTQVTMLGTSSFVLWKLHTQTPEQFVTRYNGTFENITKQDVINARLKRAAQIERWLWYYDHYWLVLLRTFCFKISGNIRSLFTHKF